MQIIRQVQIKYFRSIYATSLKSCSALNVLSGRNDVGKSNALKALNLFFNGNSDWETPLLFRRDFSLHRLDQVRKESVKGKQFIQVAIEFIRPDNYKGSLPERFVVKRTWYRDQALYSQSDNLVALYQKGKCPASLATAQKMLPRFLNRMHYEYVPAVKDRAFFSHLLSRLQSSLLEVDLDKDHTITPLAEALADHIGQQVGNLREDFSRATGLDTSIEPPRELASLFQAFQVSVPSESGQIALALRGDGMQARYIPSVLHYIASKSSAFFVWGFEEPENSLEYSNVDALAEDFEEIYSRDAQIFLTTHSPAIVSRSGVDLSCYRVWSPEGRTEIEKIVLPLATSSTGSELSREIGLLRIQQEIHGQYKEKLQERQILEDRLARLEAELKEHSRAVVLVEGVTDARILEVAWKKLKPGIEMPFLLRAADPLEEQEAVSAGGASTVRKFIQSHLAAEGRKVLGIFDHDREGTKEFGKLGKSFKIASDSGFLKKHDNGLAFAMTLAVAVPDSSMTTAKTLTIETMFSEDVLAMKDHDGHGLVLKDAAVSVNVEGLALGLDEEKLAAVGAAVGDLAPYRRIEGGKKVFSENIVPELTAGEFGAFHVLFDVVEEILI